MQKHHFGLRGFLAFTLVVFGLIVPTLANAAISLDTSSYTTDQAVGGGTGTISLSATTGDTVFLAEYNDADVSGAAPTMTGQTWTEAAEIGNGWYPLTVEVWYTTLSSSGGTVTFTIPSDGTLQPVDVLVTLDSYSGVSSVDVTATHWGKMDPGDAFCDITPTNSNSLVLGFTAYGVSGTISSNPAPDSGFTQTHSSYIGLANQMPPQPFVGCLNQYSTGNAASQVDVDSTPGAADPAYSEIAVACH